LLQVVAGGLSSSANSDESCNESEAAPRSKLLSSDQSPIRSSTAGENREENRKKKRVSIAIDPSRSKKQRESLGLCKDSGLSSAETEMESEAEVAGSDIESFRSGGPTSQPDEPSSGSNPVQCILFLLRPLHSEVALDARIHVFGDSDQDCFEKLS